jgi:hypothetical protein
VKKLTDTHPDHENGRQFLNAMDSELAKGDPIQNLTLENDGIKSKLIVGYEQALAESACMNKARPWDSSTVLHFPR